MIHMTQVAQLVPAQVVQKGKGQQDGTPVEADAAAVTGAAAAPATALVPDGDPGDGEASPSGELLQVGRQQLFRLPAAPVAQQQGGVFRRSNGIEPEFFMPDQGQQALAAGAQQQGRFRAGRRLAAALGQRPGGNDPQGRTAQGQEEVFRHDERCGRGTGGKVTFQPGQEGKQQGLGAIAGISDTYWGRNKSRSAEGTLIRATKIMAVLFIVLSVVLNMNF